MPDMSTHIREVAKIFGAAFGAGFSYSLIEPYRLQINAFDVEMPRLPSSCSAITPPAVLRRAIEKCNALRPDVVVLTGDYVSRRDSYFRFTGVRRWAKPVMEYAEMVAREIQKIHAPEGVFAVPGNHDHDDRNCNAIMELLHDAGAVPLVNASTQLRGDLPLVGVDDLRAGKLLLPQAFSGISPDEAQIVLSHNPRVTPLIQHRNALVLSGHTHAGQVHLPLTNFRMRPSDMSRSIYFQGWYASGNAKLYVNSGVGSVHFPMRFRCPPEISLFTLRMVN
jgi:uncharacterized protein